jgi:adenylyltransferase/sulfurtransferase
MGRFRFARTPFDPAQGRAELADRANGGYVAFEGWVRDHNEGLAVAHLEYESFEQLAEKEGEKIIAEACSRFGVERAACVHRLGDLGIGELAVWVGVSAPHRDEAFKACRYIIDEVKHRVPIWKKEHYVNGDSGWVNCERCATAPSAHDHEHGHAHSHAHEDALAAADAHGAAAPRADYSRQMALREVGAAGQTRLGASRVAVVGAGGLGVPVLQYLAGAGVGYIRIIDGDLLEPSNLHRQTMYALADCGEPKARLAARRLAALNPDIALEACCERLELASAPRLLAGVDLIVDCSDNFSTKFLLNDFAQALAIPALFASVYQYEGQLQSVRPVPESACLRCLWPEATRDGLVGNCAEAGVLGPVPGVFGSLQALEALKLLLDLPGQLQGELLLLDLTTLAISRLRTRRAAECSGGSCVRSDAALRTARSLAAAAPAVARADVGARAAGPVELRFASLDDAIDAGYQIVDVRERTELAAQPTPARAALHVTTGELAAGAQLPPQGRYLLVCARGSRSHAAALLLRERGVEAAYSLPGGLAALAAASATT